MCAWDTTYDSDLSTFSHIPLLSSLLFLSSLFVRSFLFLFLFFLLSRCYNFILCPSVMLVVDIVKTIDEDLKSIISGLEKTQKELIENGEPPIEMILVLNKVLSQLISCHSFFILCYNSNCNELSCCSWTWQRKIETKTVHSNAMNFIFQTFTNFSIKYF
jgi:hypothetical protein